MLDKNASLTDKESEIIVLEFLLEILVMESLV